MTGFESLPHGLSITVVDEILARERYDQVVFRGDYFDGSRDTPEQARHTAEWLKSQLS